MQHNAKTDYFMLHRLQNTLQRPRRILSGYGIINNHFLLLSRTQECAPAKLSYF